MHYFIYYTYVVILLSVLETYESTHWLRSLKLQCALIKMAYDDTCGAYTVTLVYGMMHHAKCLDMPACACCACMSMKQHLFWHSSFLSFQ